MERTPQVDCSGKGFSSPSEIPELQGPKTHLTSLNLANNKLVNLEGMAGCIKLKILQIDHNQLSSLDSLPIMLNLDTLTASGNLFSEAEAMIKNIAKKCPRLQHLNLTSNPLDIDIKSKGYRKGVKKLLPLLLSLDGVPYTGSKVRKQGPAQPKLNPIKENEKAVVTHY